MFKKPRRRVTRVFIHCSASDVTAHDNAATMDRWHKERGWSGIGYHYFIRKNGWLEKGRNLERTPAAQGGNNRGTIAICLHGLDVKKFKRAQFITLKRLCNEINRAYGGRVTFHGHCEVSAKTCPVFDYKRVLNLDSEGHMIGETASVGRKLEQGLDDINIPVTQLAGNVAGKPIWQSKTAISAASLSSIAAVSSAGREIADNTTSIFSLITSPWILVAFLIAGFGGFIIYDRMKKGREAGV